MLNSETYIGCCGARDVHGFRDSVANTRAYLKRHIENMEELFGHAFSSVILTQDQVKKYGAVLKEMGFSKKSTAVNPDSGNKLTFFLRSRKSRKFFEE